MDSALPREDSDESQGNRSARRWGPGGDRVGAEPRRSLEDLSAHAMSSTLLSSTSALFVLLVATQAVGQTAESQISFSRVREATLRALLGNFKAYENRAAVAGSSYVGSPRTGITRADSVTAVSVASAAVGADVDGALAGVTVSPLLLFGVLTPHQLKVTLATLEGGKLRVGLGYSHEGIWDPNTYQALGLAACRLTDAYIARVEREMDALEEPFLRVCRALIEVLPEGPGPNNAYLQARAACAGESLGPRNEPALNQIFALRAKAALDRARGDPNRRGDVAATEEDLQEALEKLGAFATTIRATPRAR